MNVDVVGYLSFSLNLLEANTGTRHDMIHGIFDDFGHLGIIFEGIIVINNSIWPKVFVTLDCNPSLNFNCIIRFSSRTKQTSLLWSRNHITFKENGIFGLALTGKD